MLQVWSPTLANVSCALLPERLNSVIQRWSLYTGCFPKATHAITRNAFICTSTTRWISIGGSSYENTLPRHQLAWRNNPYGRTDRQTDRRTRQSWKLLFENFTKAPNSLFAWSTESDECKLQFTATFGRLQCDVLTKENVNRQRAGNYA